MGEEFLRLQRFLDEVLNTKSEIKVLEAGCGSVSHLRFTTHAYIVGIDISEQQLERNKIVSEKILGDVQYFDFPPSSFDVIVCCYVLEHLSRPELALSKFVKAVREQGLIILNLPNVFSLKGLLTKYLPHSIHVLIYNYLQGRYLQGNSVGEIYNPGPFKTYLKASISPNSIKEFASNNGLDVVYYCTNDVASSNWLRRNRLAYAAYVVLRAATRFISLGKLGDSDYAIILQKRRKQF